MDDFTARASEAEIAALFRAVGHIARERGIVDSGYRVITNCGPDAHQEVMHFHVHLFGGRRLGGMLKRVES